LIFGLRRVRGFYSASLYPFMAVSSCWHDIAISLIDRQPVRQPSYLDPIQRLLARIARTPDGDSFWLMFCRGMY
ncbi:MAG TPA: hypothetical protein VM912_09615, partial [Terriglobales bacterium]|nr:hypothetical protein [Terriglobales bacterium]